MNTYTNALVKIVATYMTGALLVTGCASHKSHNSTAQEQETPGRTLSIHGISIAGFNGGLEGLRFIDDDSIPGYDVIRIENLTVAYAPRAAARWRMSCSIRMTAESESLAARLQRDIVALKQSIEKDNSPERYWPEGY
jgi:hypothetical protein